MPAVEIESARYIINNVQIELLAEEFFGKTLDSGREDLLNIEFDSEINLKKFKSTLDACFEK